MPWQAVPSFVIIAGAFNAAAGLMWGAQRLGFGEDKQLHKDEWDFQMHERDMKVREYQDLLAKMNAQEK